MVDAMLNAMTRNGVEHHLEPKVMKVLQVLAEHPNQVVLKDELMREVWPSTFVSDDVLTRCISMLRHIMQDSPHEPRYIQTIPKVGYRLVGEVHSLPDPLVPLPVSHALEQGKGAAAGGDSSVDEFPLMRKKLRLLTLGVVVLLVLASASGAFLWHRMNRAEAPATIHTMQFTSYPGLQSRPAFSPDGKKIAFAWAAENDKAQHIYIKALGNEALIRLTNEQETEFSPIWSPDGQQIAYLATSSTEMGLYLTSSSPGGARRKVFTPQEPTRWEQGDLSWSPDGKSLILADHFGSEPHSSIYRVDLETLRTSSLTTPPVGWEGDMSPAYSPDGTRIAFIRASETAVGDLYWITAAGGAVHRLTNDGRNINSFAWAADGQSLLFSSDRGGKYALWKIRLNRTSPERLPVGTEDATQPALGKGGLLAYTQSSALWSILRVPLAAKSDSEGRVAALLSSTQQDSAPSFSPDGSQFAFQSWRSGSQEIWIASADGQSLRQLTSFANSLTGSPSWSSHGDQIVFDARVSGHSHVFTIPAKGGSASQLTFGDANDIVPRWSADNRTIYFRSNRGGRWQLWKMPAAGGTAQTVTSDDGMIAQESPDGKWLYFTRGYEAGLWRIPTSGGPVERVLDQPGAGYWGYWAVTRRGIYSLDLRQSPPAIALYDPATGRSSRIAKLDRVPPPNSGISIQPNERALLITDKRDAESHISVAEGIQ
jgi:Tol biopolymer transport system component/DNA-binding winged helix-turn-helix (wHTH) protein